MFDEIGRPPGETITRKMALRLYGVFCFLFLLPDAADIWKHGLSRPLDLAVCSVGVVLSLISFGATLRSSKQTAENFRFRFMTIWLAMLALILLPMFCL